MNTCNTCRWWEPRPQAEQVAGHPTKGNCHFNPPTVFLMEANKLFTHYPITREQDFCSMHQPHAKSNGKARR